MIDFYADLRRATQLCSASNPQATLGEFDSMNSCIRLRPDIGRDLSSLAVPDLRTMDVEDVSDEELFAMSVFVHELMHWWQHIGTTAGFVDGLGFVAQASRCGSKIRELTDRRLLKKPLCAVARTTGEDNPEEVSLNTLVNGWMDVEYAHLLLNAPGSVGPFISDGYFDSVGSCISTLYCDFAAVMSELSADAQGLYPDLDRWVNEINRFTMIPGSPYDYRSEVRLAPLGLKAILEGQAQLTQEQFIEGAGRPRPPLRTVLGGLLPVYSEAFRYFLALAGLGWPERARSTQGNAFLFTCDLSLACNVGYPDDVADFGSFPKDVNPGNRFVAISVHFRRNPDLLRMLATPSDEVYVRSATEVCGGLKWQEPSQTYQKVVSRQASILSPGSYRGGVSSHVAFLATRHRDFAKDRLLAPGWFCWPGTFLCDHEDRYRTLGSGEKYARHYPPFTITDNPEAPLGVVSPLGKPDYKDVVIEKFVGAFVFCDLVRQFVSRDGPFAIDYRWIGGRSIEFWQEYVARILRKNLGMELNGVSLAV